MNSYQQFLLSKQRRVTPQGFDVADEALTPALFPFQRAIVRWALQLGKAAVFADTGLGKTLIELEYARHVAKHAGGSVLILAPLAVATQTVREGRKFGIAVQHVHKQADVGSHPVVITNYERLHLFDPDVFAGIVLDESGILKNFTGKTKRALISAFAGTPYKLACTATPAPNDHLELGNHAEFLDVMPSNEMIARWFIAESNKAGSYRLKGHAEADFWRWLTSWAVCLSRPADLGEDYAMDGYDLPTLHLHTHTLSPAQESIERAQANGRLLPDTNPSSTTLHKVKRESLVDRVAEVIKLVEALAADEPAVIWCDTNYEANALIEAIPEAVEVRGSEKASEKERKLDAFSRGEIRLLITKASIAGHGLNWQHCRTAIYAGVGFSFELLYQSLKRLHRYGQTQEVHAHLVYAETEGGVRAALNAKEKAFQAMQAKMNEAMRVHGLFRSGVPLGLSLPETKTHRGSNWTLVEGDCVPAVQELEENTVDLSVYSPPFANLYIYSDSAADMGNATTIDEFMTQYSYLVKEMYRVTRPGRLTVVHCKDLPLYKGHDGWFGIEDFSGWISRVHAEQGFVFHSRITLWKDPVHEMQKTNSHGLLHKNFAQRAQVCRTGLPDYLMVFVRPDPAGQGVDVKQLRTPGDYVGTQPPQEADYAADTRPPQAWFDGSGQEYNYSIAVWQRYASPVWFDVNWTRVLNYTIAKTDRDEKHIAPLSLDIARRCIDLWSNPGELVLSPFAGIGSEGHEALLARRKFIGMELKPAYADLAVKHLRNAERLAAQPTLWNWQDTT